MGSSGIRWAGTDTPSLFVNVASKGLKLSVSGLESTLTGIFVNVDSKGLALGRFGYEFDRWRPGLRLEKVATPKKKAPARSWRYSISQKLIYPKVTILSRKILLAAHKSSEFEFRS
jgi:hypothetical protein